MIAVKDVELPRRARKGDAGYDFVLPEDVTFKESGKRPHKVTIDTGIMMEDGDIPEGHVMLLFPRSSLGTQYGLQFLNTVGVIDSGYRDTIKATMCVTDPTLDILRLKKGTRFMQGVIVAFATIPGEEPPTEERTGGYGSTGLR